MKQQRPATGNERSRPSSDASASRIGHGAGALAAAVLLMHIASTAPAMPGSTALMRGVNLSGAELNPGKTRLNFDYTYPTIAEIDYFVSKGLTTFRIPVLSERLLTPSGTVDPRSPDWVALSGLIHHAADRQANVIIDLHQYGAMPSGLIGRSDVATRDFAHAWEQIAGHLNGRANVIFGLMNEPHEQSATEWLTGANAAIAAIRRMGAHQLILVPGSYWDGAHSWNSTDNADVMLRIVDPVHNFAYEVHQYLDGNSSGTSLEVVADAGETRLQSFTKWARQHHVRGFLGEFGFAATEDALNEGSKLVLSIVKNRDVWIGWTYWAAGPWWGKYPFSIEPEKGQDKEQMEILLKN